MKAERLHITIFLAIAALTWFIVLLMQGTPVTWEHASPFTSVISVLVLLGIAFEHWLWRQPFLHGWFVKRPDLRGTWRVEVRSSYIDPDAVNVSWSSATWESQSLSKSEAGQNPSRGLRTTYGHQQMPMVSKCLASTRTAAQAADQRDPPS